jgi:aspartate ammonia-lyase
MAVNEVIANRAAQLLGLKPGLYDVVSPLDHVNRSQSTNDVYPTALQLAVIDRSGPAGDALEAVAQTLDRLALAAGDQQRLGRTCLQDALPVPIAGYHGAQARASRRLADTLRMATEPLRAVPLGATAVGTGAGAPARYAELAVARLATRTRIELTPAPDLFDALAHLDPLLTVAQAAAAAAVTLAKIATDLRLLASGPVGGIGEISLPAVQLGSSIMPGKVNPVIPELVIQGSFEIRGAASVVESAAVTGELELNVMEPVVACHLLYALEVLDGMARLLAERCLSGLRWNETVVADHLAGSLEDVVGRHGEEAP